MRETAEATAEILARAWRGSRKSWRPAALRSSTARSARASGRSSSTTTTTCNRRNRSNSGNRALRAEIRDGKIFARGVSDNRGDAMARMQAVETYLATHGDLPVKVKFLIEGEEEIGSPNLRAFIRCQPRAAGGRRLHLGGQRPRRAAPHRHQSRPEGRLSTLELRFKEAKVDLHSSLATIVPNAAWRLVWALSTLKTPDDRITIDGLMDHVFTPTAEQIEQLKAIPFEEERMKQRSRDRRLQPRPDRDSSC